MSDQAFKDLETIHRYVALEAVTTNLPPKSAFLQPRFRLEGDCASPPVLPHRIMKLEGEEVESWLAGNWVLK